MRLKCLDLYGFKSFADRTRIDFHAGVTGIVGPNGCGKSNVVDAVRWALGETSAKALRGGEMADVIFNGTDKRKPLGMAEVSLTFSDCEDELDFHEVRVTRRVYRDGRSEYELNGQSCRLKDINRLFMDTGVGRSAYSIMEQGKIDLLLSAKPEDRRTVFEEAAGITKSKAEKKEALRKLEYTEANLLRVTDVLAEMKRQIASTQRQAAKARRYQELHRDVLVLDSHLHYRRYHLLAAEKAELETSVQSLGLMEAQLEEKVRDGEVELSEARRVLREKEAELAGLRQRASDRRHEMQAAEGRMGFNAERRRELEAMIAQNEAEVEAGTGRLSQQEAELRSAGEALERVRESIGRQRTRMDEQSRVTAAARQEKSRLEDGLRQARQKMHAAEAVIASSKAALAGHEAQRATDRTRREQLERDVARLREESEAKAADEQSAREKLAQLQQEVEQHTLALQQREKDLQAAEIELERIQKQLQDTARMHSERSSRADVLRQMIAAGEGLEAGTQAVLRGLDNPEFYRGGTRGLLSSLLEVDDESIPAVEAALGGSLQAVIVANSVLAEGIIGALAAQKLGRAVVLPEDLLRTPDDLQMLTMPEDGIAWTLDRVKTQPSVEPLIRRLLGNVLIVGDLATALRLKRENPSLAFATLNGEFVSAEGAVHGGAASEKQGSMLQRQAELRDLDSEVSLLADGLKLLESRREKGREQARDLKTQVDEQRELLQNRRVAASTVQGQLTLIAREIQQITSRIESLEWEQTEMSRRDDDLARRIAEAEAKRAAAEQELATLGESVSRFEADLAAAARNEADAVELLNELRTALAVEQRAEQSLLQQHGPMNSRVRELQESISRRQREIESYRERIRTAGEEDAKLRAECEAAREDVEQLTHSIAALSEELGTAQESVSAREEAIAAARREASGFASRRSSEEVRIERLTLRMESLATYAQERYQIDLLAFEQDIHALLTTLQSRQAAKSRQEKRRATQAQKPAEETEAGESRQPAAAQDGPDAAPAEPETQEVPAAADEAHEPAATAAEAADDAGLPEGGPDWDAVEILVAELKQRLDSMGPVNLDAIQEYEELEERYNFLQREHDDLVNAKGELLNIIQRINIESKKRFVETFQQVRENFRSSFKELFGSAGQADLVLVNEDDPLESGIEVIAKPPGKKPTSITLLSGGERSMTAVALLFSIYMVKPSPFCILDELDAPLDESNIGRFLKMLDKFIGKSQFVIVTHNKRTMHRADVLYGVTMEEYGVSKPVGMVLSDESSHHRSQYVPPPEAPAAEEPAPESPAEEPETAAAASAGPEPDGDAASG